MSDRSDGSDRVMEVKVKMIWDGTLIWYEDRFEIKINGRLILDKTKIGQAATKRRYKSKD